MYPLVLSSFFFQIPAYYAYRHGFYVYAASSFITSVLSINYWRRPTLSWRRTLDIVWARSAGTFFFIDGMRHTSVLTSVSVLLFMLGFYYLSVTYPHHPQWYLYHMTFHGIAALSQCAVTYSIIN